MYPIAPAEAIFGPMARPLVWIIPGTLVLALIGCKKDEPGAKAPAPAVVYGDTAAAGDPANLPAAGEAPAGVSVGGSLAAMWETPIHTLQGKPTTLGAFRGKALLVVNVASKCGLTPQYTALEALQKKYADQGFSVVGFPCNQFGAQEPGSAEEIAQFCSATYGVTFPMMEKVDVNGTGRHSIYKELTPIADADGHTGDIRWNFEKFVISSDGNTVTRFSPKVTPDDPSVIAAIEAGLPKQ
jgi:glutathione peroxidase